MQSLLPRVDEEGAERIVERIRQGCQRVEVSPIPISIALGTATRDTTRIRVSSLLQLAEERMYAAKLRESRKVRADVIDSIRKSLEEHAGETQAHGDRLKEISLALARRVGLSEYEMNQLEHLAMIHDIGKIAIPKCILFKKDVLELEEWSKIRKHSEIGYRIAAYSPELAFIADPILYHHERWDGKGYPQGLNGAQIPITARILSIADSYDIMTYGRPYRKRVSPEEALEEIQRCSGTQFDPDLVEHFITIMEENKQKQAL